VVVHLLSIENILHLHYIQRKKMKWMKVILVNSSLEPKIFKRNTQKEKDIKYLKITNVTIVPDPTAGIQEIILEAYTTLNWVRSSEASCHQHELQSPHNRQIWNCPQQSLMLDQCCAESLFLVKERLQIWCAIC